MEEQDGARVATAYLRFAEDEVRDLSPLYGELLHGVASDPEVIGFLLTLPREKRQPNLFLAAARHLFGMLASWDQFRSDVLQDKDALRATMLARSTQTNEPGRCAALLPVLAGLPEPLALLEVGASAGLCHSRSVCRTLPAPRFLRLRLWQGYFATRAAAFDATRLSLRGQCRDAGPGKTTAHRLEG